MVTIFLTAGAILLFFVMLLPIRVQLDIHRGERRLMRVTLAIGALMHSVVMESTRTQQGRQIELRGRNGATRRLRASDSQRRHAHALLRALRNAPAARRFLADHVHPLQLDAQWMLHTASAAATALLTGAVRTALTLLPRRWLRLARIRVLPDFLRDHQTLQVRCIFWLRPGTLLITAGLILSNRAMQAVKREDHLWNIPSEN